MTSPVFNRDDNGVTAKLEMEVSDKDISNMREVADLARDIRSNIQATVEANSVFREQMEKMPVVDQAYSQVTSEVASHRLASNAPQRPDAGPPSVSDSPSQSRNDSPLSLPTQGGNERRTSDPGAFYDSPDYRSMIRGTSGEEFMRRRQVNANTYDSDSHELIKAMEERGLLKQEADEDGQMRYTYKGKDVDNIHRDKSLRGAALNALTTADIEADENEFRESIKAENAAKAEAQEIRGNKLAAARAAGNVLKGVATGRGNLAADSTKALQATGSVGGALKVAGVAGTGLAALAAAKQVVDTAGENYQSIKNIGTARGGGFAEGVEQKFDIWQKDFFNPFLNSRQVEEMVGTIEEAGYSGYRKDEMYDFMSNNMMNHNLNAKQSAKLAKTAEESGQSLAKLNGQLEKLKSLAGDNEKSLAMMQEQYSATKDALVAKGATGQDAGQIGLITAQMYADNPTGVPYALADDMTQLMSGMYTDPRFLMGLGFKNEDGSTMTNTTAIAEVASRNPEQMPQEYLDYLKGIVDKIDKDPGIRSDNKVAMFAAQAKISDPNTASYWYQSLKSGEAQDQLDEAIEKTQGQKEVKVNEDSEQIGDSFWDYVPGVNVGSIASKDTSKYKIDALEDQIAAGTNSDDIKFVNEDGEVVGTYEDVKKGNKELGDKFASGEINAQFTGDKAMEDKWLEFAAANGLEEYDSVTDALFGGSEVEKNKAKNFLKESGKPSIVTADQVAQGDIYGDGGNVAAGEKYAVEVGLTPEAKKYFTTKTTKKNANAGLPDNANDPKPGETD